MQKKKTPDKLPKLLEKIKECVESGNYVLSKHALDRQNERDIDTTTTLYVLKNGYEEKRKTIFDIEHNTWKYAIRGKSKDGLNIRVIITFDSYGMIIITTMHVV